jgi:hypothetical protein
MARLPRPLSAILANCLLSINATLTLSNTPDYMRELT